MTSNMNCDKNPPNTGDTTKHSIIETFCLALWLAKTQCQTTSFVTLLAIWFTLQQNTTVEHMCVWEMDTCKSVWIHFVWRGHSHARETTLGCRLYVKGKNGRRLRASWMLCCHWMKWCASNICFCEQPLKHNNLHTKNACLRFYGATSKL